MQEQPRQQYTSEATSRSVVPAIYRRLYGKNDTQDLFFRPGSINLDLGGGRYDHFTEKLAEHGVENLVLDPYNRSLDHNRQVIQRLEQVRGADTVTLSNVLNVIKEHEVRCFVLRQASLYLRPGGWVFVNVYDGDRTSVASQTRDGWQENRPLRTYLPEVRVVFPDSLLQAGLIYGRKADA